MRSLPRALPALALVSLFLACGSTEREPIGAQPASGEVAPGEGPFSPDAAAPSATPQVCQKMDILFVIDDSGSMGEEQSGLIASFPQFVSVLENFRVNGDLPLDYRVAVTTTGRDVRYTVKTSPPMPELSIPFDQKGMNGVLRQDCGLSRRWIERNDGNVSSTFSCLAKVGTQGPGEEMPLLATELALGDRMADGTNQGFLRDDALLALVLITDDEDCSRRDNDFVEYDDRCDIKAPQMVPVAHFVDFLNGVKRGAGRWAAAAIAGQHDCSSTFGSAFESKRLKEFVGLGGQNAVLASICDGNLAKALETALTTFKTACTTFPPPK